MPKGVEHFEASILRDINDYVPRSLMPKGVEHGIMDGIKGVFAGSSSFVDAERR